MAGLLFTDRLHQELQRLPSLSVVVVEALAILDKPNLDLALLESKIEQDQALSARILRIANSPFYGVSRQIVSIHDAIVVLGVHTVRNVVATAGIISRFPADGKGRFDRLAFWRHSIGTGIAAKVLARHLKFDGEAAFMAGLLHDIGKLVLDAMFPEEFNRILDEREASGGLLRDAERAVLQSDHAVVGEKVATRWRMPPIIQAGIAGHHVPDEKPAVVSDLVHLSDIVCRGLEIGSGGDDAIPELSPGAWERLGIGMDKLRASLHDIEALNEGANLFIHEAG